MFGPFPVEEGRGGLFQHCVTQGRGDMLGDMQRKGAWGVAGWGQSGAAPPSGACLPSWGPSWVLCVCGWARWQVPHSLSSGNGEAAGCWVE